MDTWTGLVYNWSSTLFLIRNFPSIQTQISWLAAAYIHHSILATPGGSQSVTIKLGLHKFRIQKVVLMTSFKSSINYDASFKGWCKTMISGLMAQWNWCISALLQLHDVLLDGDLHSKSQMLLFCTSIKIWKFQDCLQKILTWDTFAWNKSTKESN